MTHHYGILICWIGTDWDVCQLSISHLIPAGPSLPSSSVMAEGVCCKAWARIVLVGLSNRDALNRKYHVGGGGADFAYSAQSVRAKGSMRPNFLLLHHILIETIINEQKTNSKCTADLIKKKHIASSLNAWRRLSKKKLLTQLEFPSNSFGWMIVQTRAKHPRKPRRGPRSRSLATALFNPRLL